MTGSGYKYSSIVMCGEIYGSSESRLSRSSIILASWCGLDGEISQNGDDIRPGAIRFFLTFFINTNEGKKLLTLAFINWLQKVRYRHVLCPMSKFGVTNYLNQMALHRLRQCSV